MPLAGETIIAGKVPGERVATAIVTADSSTWTTTEVVVMTVVAPLVSGRTYRVSFDGGIRSPNNAESSNGRIREDSVSGTQLTVRRADIEYGATVMPWRLEAEYTAVATGDKTFVVTGVRASGAGAHFLTAGAQFPSYLYVDYLRG